MRISFVLLFLLFFKIATFGAEHDHTADVCTDASPQICAHLGHFSEFTTNSNISFIAHVTTPQNEPISDLTADILMPSLNLNSSTLFISQMDINKYKVQRVQFTASGQWFVILNFSFAGVRYQLTTPITVRDN